jgi:acetylornithine deacetylase/succinyl-diaminopimelate desuccinylase-like protein
LSVRIEEVLTDLVLLGSTAEDPIERIVDYVSSKLKRLGIEPRLRGTRERPAIVGQFGHKGVVLSGHLDTVPLGTGWKHEQAEVSGGYVFGRGSCDMKGGCTAMLIAAEELVAANVPFTLCFTTDEETTMKGAADAAKDPAIRSAPAILITEPSDFDIVVKEKGLLHFTLETSGKAAHASMPALGENAIAKMVKLLGKLEDLQKMPRDQVTEMTLSVDTIHGGTRINVIPSECVAEVDVRYPLPLDPHGVVKLITDRVGTEGYHLKVLHQLDPVETDPRSAPVTTLLDILGKNARVSAVPYATEMVMFKVDNPRVMVCGPGEANGCHIIDEKISLAEVERAIGVYVEYCSRMAGS